MSLPAGVSALLIDQRKPVDTRCCGGLIAHDAQNAIKDLDLVLPDKVRIKPEPRDVHVLDLDSDQEQTYRRDYWNINRALFDAWLLELAMNRVKFWPGTRFTGAEKERHGFTVRLSRKGSHESIHCRFIVGADGAKSRVRRVFFPEKQTPALAIALQAALPACKTLTSHEVIFSSRLTDFYAWAIPKDDHILVGSAFQDIRTPKANFERILRTICRIYSLDDRILDRCARPLSRPKRKEELLSGNETILLAGEAAGLISPSSGEGISYALQSGCAAGQALATGSPSTVYQPRFSSISRKVARKFIKAKVVFTPWTRRLAMRIRFYP